MNLTKTKIVCTIGPSVWDEENLKKLILESMDVARLNFSHGDHETHRRTMERLRKVSAEVGIPVAILQDLGGPKIRLGKIPDPGIEVKEGDRISLTSEEVNGEDGRFYVSYPYLEEDLKPGEHILVDDGLVQMTVEEIKGKDVVCHITVGGMLKAHKGVNLPHSSLRISALTDKDIEDVKFGMDMGVDFVALSFVRKAADIQQLKSIMEEHGKQGEHIPIIAKVEKREAVQNLDEIITESDGIMVARGDLGVETPIEEVPLIQKEIIRKCNEVGKPVITATQMLDSMIRNPMPTRAEVTDIANAILDGTDAVMLSGETASGKYPIDALKTMDKIARATEIELFRKLSEKCYCPSNNVVDSISEATCKISEELEAKGIIVMTDSGRTARQVSRCKPKAPILAVTYTDASVRRLKLSWGVFPLKIEAVADTDKTLSDAADAALASGIVNPGDLVITTAGIPVMVKGSTNMIKVDVLGHVFVRGIGVGPQHKVTGRVIIALTADEAEKRVEKGDILFTNRLDDSFVQIAGRLGGVVAEEGTHGSYAEFFCERFKIPGIVGVPGALSKFFTGRIVTLEPDRGIVYGASGTM
jgi:pyruvate kinase